MAKIHHVALRATDFDKSFAFYTKVIGLKPEISWGEGDKRAAMLAFDGDGRIELFAGGKAGEHGEPIAGQWLHFAFEVEDVRKMYDDAIAAGCTSRTAPKEVIIDSKPYQLPVDLAFVLGPDGEVIEFFHPKKN